MAAKVENEDGANANKPEMMDAEVAEEAMSSGEDDSDDSEEEGQNDKRIAELEATIKASPFMYDPYVELIKLHRADGELDRLRETRQKMSEIFPLAEGLWLEWLEDEMKVVSNSREREKVNKLFERAVQDYLSVSIWLEYVQFSIGGMAEENGMVKIREVFERAVTAAGLHVTNGTMLWEAYREFEHAIFDGLQPQPGSVASAEQQAQITAQTNKILSIFRRQLSIPLNHMEQTMVEYKEWCTADVEPHVQQVYDKCQQKLKELRKLEQKLSTSEPPHLEAYQAYIEHELKGKEPSRIQCIFERALQANCLVPDLWIKYTKYLDNELRIKDVIFGVYERAVRNCPWSVDLWLGFVRALERHQQSHNAIKEKFDKALGAGFTQGAEYLQIWTAYCDYLRRRIDWDEEHADELDELRAVFDKAITALLQSFPADGDPNCTLSQYWARTEAKYCHNMTKARELWNNIMQQGFGNQAQMWLEYYNIERSFGDHKHCRKVLQRAINSVTDWPESVCEAFINFEREEGTLEQYDQAMVRYEHQMKRVEERRAQQAEKEARQTGKKKDQKPKDGQKPKKQQKWEQPKQQQQQKKQKHKESPPSQVPETSPGKEDRDGFLLPTFSPPVYKRKAARLTADEATTKKLRADSDIPPGDGPKVPPGAPPGAGPKVPPGAPGPKVPPGAPGPKVPPGAPPGSGPKVPPGAPVKEQTEKPGDPSKDKRTVFVSNLAYSVDEDKLREIFLKLGEISEIRLIRNARGGSKGFAYVEFVDELPVPKALQIDRTLIENRPMYVSECQSSSSSSANPKPFKYGSGLEKNKLFVKGLPFTTTKEAVETIFGEHGKLKDVRLVTYRSGAFKGLAFVEYENESDAGKAVLKADGLQIGEHTISVAISNPPERNAPLKQREFTPTLGGGKRDFGSRGKAHTQVALMPRSLKQKTKAPATSATKTTATGGSTVESMDTEHAETATEAGAKLSNADFRNMLFKK